MKSKEHIKKIKYLHKINTAAKVAKKLKQKAYDDHEYALCTKYKDIQLRLYLLKSLLLIQMYDDGEVSKFLPCIGKNGEILETFSAEEYTFHCPLSEMYMSYCPSSVKANFLSDSKNLIQDETLIYLPYSKFLEKTLPTKLKEIYDNLIENKFSFSTSEASCNFFIKLQENNVMAEHLNTRYVEDDAGRREHVSLCLNAIKLCTINIFIPDIGRDEDMVVKCDDGILTIDEYDPYEKFID